MSPLEKYNMEMVAHRERWGPDDKPRDGVAYRRVGRNGLMKLASQLKWWDRDWNRLRCVMDGTWDRCELSDGTGIEFDHRIED